MEFQETKFAQHEGKFTEYVNVDNGAIQLQATNTLLRLMNAFPPEDPMIAAQVGVKVIKLDIPWHPNDPPIDVTPTDGNRPQRELKQPPTDPRPKD